MNMPMTSETAMGMATPTHAATAAAASSTSAMSMGGMGGMGGMSHAIDHGMAMGGCKISMLWNWNVEDACFISKSWHVTSKAMFAGSCIGTVCLVILLELLRRSVKEYDRFLLAQHFSKSQGQRDLDISRSSSTKVIVASSSGSGSEQEQQKQQAAAAAAALDSFRPFRPSAAQQAVRALLHTMQFAVAYFIMLLAMYYNGYIILCIFIGAYLGSFIFHWEPLNAGSQTSAAKEATVCCA